MRYADQHVLKHTWWATQTLAEHELLGETYWSEGRGARWFIAKPGHSEGATEIIAGIFGSLVVHGDYEVCRFAHYGDKDSAWSRLLWMADHHCVVDSYVCEKAHIGMRSVGTEGYDEEAATEEIEQYIAELEEEENGSTDRRELIYALRDALDHTESEAHLRQFLGERDRGWDLWEHEFGRVVPMRIIFAHAALRRCMFLLLEKYGPDGPIVE